MATLSYKLLMTLSILALISMSVPAPAQDGVGGPTPMAERAAVSPLPVPEMATEEELAVDDAPGAEVRGTPGTYNADESADSDDSPTPTPTVIEPASGPDLADSEPKKPWWRFW